VINASLAGVIGQAQQHDAAMEAGEMLEIPPGVRHTLHNRQAPFKGFTFRVPIPDGNDKVEY
jgi:mannose-6-phosphate isomerase-like protein (cupin superfamily)